MCSVIIVLLRVGTEGIGEGKGADINFHFSL